MKSAYKQLHTLIDIYKFLLFVLPIELMKVKYFGLSQ